MVTPQRTENEHETTPAPAGDARLGLLRTRFLRLRGDPVRPPDLSVVVPVNAQDDLQTVMGVVGDVARYDGRCTLELVLVVNNYPLEEPPPAIEAFAAAGIRTVARPTVWTPGEVVSFSARLPGVRVAASRRVVLFDADCRVRHPTLVIDWYARQLAAGTRAAYTRVGYYDLPRLWSVRAQLAVHYSSRWVKRAVLRIPTLRGSNYAVDRETLLGLHADGLLGDDLNVGPAVRAIGGRVAYSGARRLAVRTSGRRFTGGWYKLYRYLRYRLRYNRQVLPVSPAGRAARARYHATNMRARER